MAKYFRLGTSASLVIRPPSKPQIAITRLASQNGLPERTASIPREKAFVVSVHLTPACDQGCEIWVDDRYSRITAWPAGGVGIYDLEANPRWRNRGPLDWVQYHVLVRRSTPLRMASKSTISRVFDASMEPSTKSSIR